jgi:hypothetical protein
MNKRLNELNRIARLNKIADSSFGVSPIREGTTIMIFKKVDGEKSK